MADRIREKEVEPTMKPKLEPGQTRQSMLQGKRDAAKAKLSACKRVPQGTMTKALETFRNAHDLTHDYSMDMFRKHLAFDEFVSEWRKVVQAEFDGIWAVECNKAIGTQSAKAKDTQPATGSEPGAPAELCDQGSGDSKEELRTCRTTLRHILRQELVPEHDYITQRLDSCQVIVTEITTEMTIVAQKAAILIAGGSLNNVVGFPEPLSAEFNIKTLLPANFPFRADVNPVVNAAPIPIGMQERLENGSKSASTRTHYDLIRLFSPDCMRYLYTAFLGPRGSQNNTGNHPLWDSLVTAIVDNSDAPTLSSSPTGIACTIAEHMTQLSTALTNMWEGSIYDKSLDYALRILLRLHLAPNRELECKERVKTAAQRKKEKAAKVKKLSRSSWQLRVRQLCDEVADLLSKGNSNEHRFAAIRGRLHALQQEEPIPIVKSLPPLEQQLQESESRGAGQGPLNGNDDTGLACNTILAVEDPDQLLGETEDDDEDEDEDDDGREVEESEIVTVSEASPGPAQKEPSRQRLRALQAVLKMLLESPSIQENINSKWVRASGFAKEDFTKRECEVVAYLANTLRPYVPKVKQDDQGRTIRPPAHVALRASFVLIANSVLRAAGYPDFARRIAPQVSAGSTHALHLGAVGVYETFCSVGDFEIMDQEGHLLTSRMSVTQPVTNKKVVVGAFLNITAVDALCRSHGLLFRDRLTYVDPYTVELTGSVIKEGRNPISSKYERRRKTAKGQHKNYWLDAFVESGLTKEEVFAKAAALADDVKEQEKEVKAKRRKVSTSLKIQTALKDNDMLEKSSASRNKLKEAQQTLRLHREELEPLEEALRSLRSDRYRYNKMEKAAAEATTDLTSRKHELDTRQQSGAKTETVPTWDRPACEDKAEKTDIRELIRSTRGTSKLVTVAGTDYGFVTMSETVPLTIGQVEKHLNRFGVLQDHPDTVLEEELSEIKLPKAIKISSAQIDTVSKTRVISKRREKRLRKSEEVQAAMTTITRPVSSLSLASTLSMVDQAHQSRKSVGRTLQKFERSKARLKDLHLHRMRSDRAWKKLCADERRQVQKHALRATPG
ncbi:hypothetical protein BGZ70_003732 [Mortierella alpina]|uniref:Uncharacterized protein n=1 Tax=Mortierella alpina TaxID=64518 RepID=A0A9P6JDS0_MORAP|nr:hypothetical protein BGZ70_003732 [Mortierella alpina]